MRNILIRILFSALVLGFSFTLAILIGDVSITTNFWDSIAVKSWLIIFGIQIAVFLPSFVFKTEHYFDITGGLTFISILIFLSYNLIMKDNPPFFPKLFTLSLIGLWAIRLSSFLFIRVKRAGKDLRFDEIKKNFLRFMIAWILQGLWVFMCLLPVIAMTSSSQSTNFMFSLIGVFLWLTGWLIEVVSDIQKTRFNAVATNKGNFINTGLWSISRHPNYFGEFVLWLGITIIAFPSLSEFQYLAILTPIFVYLLLKNVSGVNLLEEIANNRWGDDQNYKDYKKNTPVFFPKIFNR
jgi:steroid 5-alpha reductase family enzyme